MVRRKNPLRRGYKMRMTRSGVKYTRAGVPKFAKAKVPKFRMSRASRAFWRAPHPAYPQVPVSVQLKALKGFYNAVPKIEPLALATTVAEGNYRTRNFRQKPIVGLETFKHKPNPQRVFKASKAIEIPTVSSRRTKDILLATSTMPYKKKATNSKNKVNVKRVTAKTPVKALAQQVKALQKAVNVDKATHIYKGTYATSVKSLTGRCNHQSINACALADIESACANLRYYDPATPGTLVTANASTGTFARDVHFVNYYFKLLMRNNYQVPVKVKVYLCKVKNDCNELPTATYTSAITDQVINAGVDETDMTIHLTDIERVKEVWNVDCIVDKQLEPGQEATASHATGPFNFDPSHVDSFTNSYQQTFKGSVFVIRVEGVLGHDTSAAEYSLLPAGVDVLLTKKAYIEYDAGVDLDDIYIADTLAQAFTNGGVVSLKPVADNIIYSVA